MVYSKNDCQSSKYQSIIIDKKKQDHKKGTFEIGDEIVETLPSVKLLGVQIDDKLNFSLHITNICRPVANPLNASIRLKRFLSFESKKVLVNSYLYLHFNYCSLVWMFSSAKSLYNDYESRYDTLIVISGKVNMKVSRLRRLCFELYKKINSINISFMNETFRLRVTIERFVVDTDSIKLALVIKA